MQEIKCPKCGEVFLVDESGYAAIVKQVRDKEFEKEISDRQSVYQAEKDSAVKIAVTEMESQKDKEISELRATLTMAKAEAQLEIDKIASAKDKQLAEKELEISKLKGELELNKTSTDLAVKNAVQQKETTILELKNQIKLKNNEWN